METISFEELKRKLLEDPATRKEYEDSEREFQVAKEIMKLRIEKNLTQKELAKLAGTSQPAISRLETGSYQNLTLRVLDNIAKALGTVPVIHFEKTVGVH